MPRSGLPRLIALGNLIAVALLLPALWFVNGQSHSWGYDAAYSEGAYDQTGTGITLDGEPVTNIFAYGADGKPMKNVQLFDQDGHPLATSVPGGTGCLDPACNQIGVWVPSVLETGTTAWNVFPMQMSPSKFYETSGQEVPEPSSTPQDRTPPFIKVPTVTDAANIPAEKVVKGNG